MGRYAVRFSYLPRSIEKSSLNQRGRGYLAFYTQLFVTVWCWKRHFREQWNRVAVDYQWQRDYVHANPLKRGDVKRA